MEKFVRTGVVPEPLDLKGSKKVDVYGNLSAREEFYVAQLNTFNTSLLAIFPAILIVIGILGNFVTLIVLHQRVFDRSSIAIVLRFLAYFDVLVLGAIVSRYLVIGIKGKDIRDFSENFCRVHQTLQLMLTTCTNWAIVLIAFVRYISLKYPFRAPSLVSVDRLRTCIVAILLFSVVGYVLTYSQFFRKYTVKDPGYKSVEFDKCTINYGTPTQEVIYKGLQMLPETILPSLLIFAFNLLLVFAYRDLTRKKLDLQIKCITYARHLNTLKRNNSASKETPTSSIESVRLPVMSREDSITIKSILTSSKKSFSDESSNDTSSRTTSQSEFSDVEFQGKVIKFPGDKGSSPMMSSNSKNHHKRLVRFLMEAEDDDNNRNGETSKLYVKRQIQIINEQRRLRRATLAYTTVKKAENALDFSISQRVYLLPPRRPVLRDVRGFAPVEEREPRCPVKSPSLPTEIFYATLLFCLFNFPFCFWYIVSPMTFTLSPVGEAEHKLVITVAIILKYSSNCFNFLIYSFLSQKFLNELSRIFMSIYSFFCCR